MDDPVLADDDSVETVVEVVIGGPLEDSVFVPTNVDSGTSSEVVVTGEPVSVGVVAVAPMVLTACGHSGTCKQQLSLQ